MKLLIVGVLVGCQCALALNPSLEVNQYGHAAWTVRSGFFKDVGTIYSMAQTPDGYLWLGTGYSLLRFDGVRALPWQPPAGQRLPDGPVFRLYASRDGRLWIGTTHGLASWKEGKLTEYPELSNTLIMAILEDSHGAMWVAGGKNEFGAAKLCTIRNEKLDCAGSNQFSEDVTSLYEDRAGNLWVAETKGLWRWRPGPPTRVYTTKEMQVFSLIEGDRGEILMSDREGGALMLRDGRVGSYTPSGLTGKIISTCSFRDRNGAWWIGTSARGIIHAYNGRTDTFDQSDGLSSDYVWGIFEDREGNIWVLSTGGLDQFHDVAAPAVWLKQGLSAAVRSVLATRDGSVWLGTLGGGLNRWQNGRMTVYRRRAPEARNRGRLPTSPYVQRVDSDELPGDGIESLFEDAGGRIWLATRQGVSYFEQGRFFPVHTHTDFPSQNVYSILEDSAHNIWTVQDDGLFRLRGNELTGRIDRSRLGHDDAAYSAIADRRSGGMWLGFSAGGVAHFAHNSVRESYAIGDGTEDYLITELQLDDDGTLWFGSKAGLSCVKNGRLSTLTRRNGLPCDHVMSMIDDEDHAIWMDTNCGLVRIARSELETWIRDPNRMVQTTLLDASDGVRNTEESMFHPRATKAQDGKLWFVTLVDGVNIVDPRNLFVNKLPPPVQVEQITADGKAYNAERGLRLPPRVRDLSIRYTALSFVASEKIHFRYKLEGQDPNWREVVNDREVQYSNLGPGSHRFRLTASNNSGVWNESGDSFEFFITPAYYQTYWFRALIAAAALVMIVGLYRVRLYQIRREFDAHLEGRVDERLRIARELHDTLLQSFQASLVRMQVARNFFPERSEQAVQNLDSSIKITAEAIAEGRRAIQQLRSQPAVQGDLPQLLTVTGQELARSYETRGNSVIFRVIVEGKRQALEPLLQDEVHRIASELLRNAFQHAQATQIEAEVRYDQRVLRVYVRDNGKGIDPEILKEGGRVGHWGLPGMNERAKRIGAQLDFWSEAGRGAEVQLTVPASVAYRAPYKRWRFPRLLKSEPTRERRHEDNPATGSR